MITYSSLIKNSSNYFDNPVRKNYLNLGITIITIIILLLMIYPAIFYLLNLNSQLTKSREISGLLAEKIVNIKQAKGSLDSLTESLTSIDQALPNSATVAEYLKTLEQQLQQSQAVISKLQIDETPLSQNTANPHPQISTITYSLTLTGDYNNLKLALDKIEKLGRFTDITQASFSNKKEQGSGLTLVLKAKTYFYGTVDQVNHELGAKQ